MLTLKNDFYKVTAQVEEGGLPQFSIKLNPQHFIFKAHFPGEPVTPGVCLVQMAKELVETWTNRPLSITYVKNVKFLAVVSPVSTPEFDFQINRLAETEDGQELAVQMTATAMDKTTLVKLSFVCQPNDPTAGK